MTLDQLKRLLKVASEEKLSVRCAGSGHSWSPIFSDRNNVLIYMENIKSDYEDGSRIRISPVSSVASYILNKIFSQIFNVRYQLCYYI